MSTPSRSLSLAGASNFRDLGGYIGHDGRPCAGARCSVPTIWAALTPDDQAALARLGLGAGLRLSRGRRSALPVRTRYLV
jgi:protein-tyrosine phosphatase